MTEQDIEDLAFDLVDGTTDLYGDKRREAITKLTAWRDKILHEAAETIRAAHRDLPAEFWAAQSAGAACANLIDPDKREQP